MPSSKFKRKAKILLFLCSVITLIILHFWNCLGSTFDALGKQKLSDHNQEYLKTAEDESFKTFLVFSALKSGLAVMQSSQAGISFILDVDVQVGKFLESSQEVVNYGWYASFASMSAISFMKMLLEWLKMLDPYLLNLFLIALLFHYFLQLFFPRIPKIMTEVIDYTLFITILSYLIIPLTIYGTALTSEIICHPKVSNIRAELTDNHQGLMINHTQSGLKSQAEGGISSYLEAAGSIKDKEHHLTTHIVEHLGVVFFNILVFPFSFLIFMIFLLRRFSKSCKMAT